MFTSEDWACASLVLLAIALIVVGSWVAETSI